MKQEKEESHTRAALLEQTLEPSMSTVTAKTLPFHMSRTGTKNLPVYETSKAGGSKHITQIRKLSGDLQEMQRQLRTILQLPETIVDKKGRKKEPVMINHLTQQIIVKGWRGPEVKKWAEMVGF
ncbi:54S ribosomal protein img2, mitochondrial [Neophaeococcomyces mojaviensis]|uniref:54S ribosomal protein img2, mitochondrial n=1 Tax=Neophaeococcomyces mojaviensis TaxID=3383035 RepID=A0ACC2ZY04_9EURO|nr:54S ribosomal protein img2, mitochondrial [Knufia sp. JES_112]